MKAHGLPLTQPTVLRDALVRRGWDVVHAEAAAAGLIPHAVLVEPIAEPVVDLLRGHALQLGVECLTGPDWALLAGSRTAIGALGRPDRLPPELWDAIGVINRAAEARVGVWTIRGRDVNLQKPFVFGILNVTPDSFSDGGLFLEPVAALRQAEVLVEAGADGLDLGAESTRPGVRDALSSEEEWGRLAQVLPQVRQRHPEIVLSVDTAKAPVAQRALEAGADVINDVTGLRHDPAIADVCATYHAGLILMHSRGRLGELATYERATYPDGAVREVADELATSTEHAARAGIPDRAIVIDPGLGFQKQPSHNWEILRGLGELSGLGYPVLVGPSRKRFLADAADGPPALRDDATAMVCAFAFGQGARLFRVHDVRRTRDALAVATIWEGS